MKKIMFVDDEPDQIATIKKVMKKESDEYEIIAADSGMKCLEILKYESIPDLIFLDIMMPEMTGWQVYDRLKANETWKNIPIVFLTARTDDIASNAGKFLGDDFIEKPVNVQELKKRIDLILKK